MKATAEQNITTTVVRVALARHFELLIMNWKFVGGLFRDQQGGLPSW